MVFVGGKSRLPGFSMKTSRMVNEACRDAIPEALKMNASGWINVNYRACKCRNVTDFNYFLGAHETAAARKAAKMVGCTCAAAMNVERMFILHRMGQKLNKIESTRATFVPVCVIKKRCNERNFNCYVVKKVSSSPDDMLWTCFTFSRACTSRREAKNNSLKIAQKSSNHSREKDGKRKEAEAKVS